jgi:predicted RNA-binding protein with PIN domain
MKWILVDGYSVIHSWPQLRKLAGKSLAKQRDVLIRVLRQYGDHCGCRVTVVFDGYAAKHRPDVQEPVAGVEVMFSGAGQTADDVIERMVGTSESPGQITVITSDNLERQTVESVGAGSMSAEMFELEARTALRELEQLVRRHGRSQQWGGLRERFEG